MHLNDVGRAGIGPETLEGNGGAGEKNGACAREEGSDGNDREEHERNYTVAPEIGAQGAPEHESSPLEVAVVLPS